jgi:tripartite ATP-independent transporter DctP family solute receptor
MKLMPLVRVTALAGAVIGLGAAAPALAKDWRGWNIHPDGYPNSVAMEQFAQEVTEGTEGRINATVYNGGVLGSQPDAIEQTRNGALDFANFNMGPMGPIVPETNVLSLPFLFTGEDQMHKVMDGDMGNRFSDAMETKGLVALSWFDSGSRSMYSTQRPIMTPADVGGLKVRVMNNDLYVDMIDAMGGNATPMAYSEVYQSLKTGVVDGAENNYPSFESSNHYEVARYYSKTEHLIIPECLCIAKASWDALSEADQQIVREAAVRAAETQRQLWAERSEKSRMQVESSGVMINEVEDKKAFQDAMKPVYAKFYAANPELESWVVDIQSTH